MREGKAVAIGQRAFAVLETLLGAQGQLVTKSELLAAAWPKVVVEESNLSVQVATLRKLLGPSPDGGNWILTVSRLGYRFSGDAAPADGEPVRQADTVHFQHKPSIAVLPFANLSGDSRQEYFVDGIVEDIITALSRFRWFFVIARNSSFAYKGRTIDVRRISQELGVGFVLEGSLRKLRRRVRISAQLIDAATGNHVWAENYDFDLGDMFIVQDQIAEQVAGAMEPELLKSASARSAEMRPDADIPAWDLVRQGTFLFHKVARKTHLRAAELFREARAIAPAWFTFEPPRSPESRVVQRARSGTLLWRRTGTSIGLCDEGSADPPDLAANIGDNGLLLSQAG